MIDHKLQYAIQFVIDLYDGMSSATLKNELCDLCFLYHSLCGFILHSLQQYLNPSAHPVRIALSALSSVRRVGASGGMKMVLQCLNCSNSKKKKIPYYGIYIMVRA